MVIECGAVFVRLFYRMNIPNNKENELKPIKKQHECAIFYYVVMPVYICAHERAYKRTHTHSESG